ESVIPKSTFALKGVVEEGRKNLKEMSKLPDENRVKPVEEKVFKNPEPSSMKGFNIDKLA
ncbi:MAG TPA: hypothetical protein PK906_14180, partial [Spirochaetota bacterium]|nr:hypothetical protein [Spirochaetota bacterium]